MTSIAIEYLLLHLLFLGLNLFMAYIDNLITPKYSDKLGFYIVLTLGLIPLINVLSAMVILLILCLDIIHLIFKKIVTSSSNFKTLKSLMNSIKNKFENKDNILNKKGDK